MKALREKTFNVNTMNLTEDLTVNRSVNSFGDQIITYYYVGENKSKPNKLTLSFEEGSWTEFTAHTMLQLWKVNTFTPEELR